MSIPVVERTRLMVGKYEVVAQPIPGAAHMLRYTVFVGKQRIGALVSRPTESDCRFLEKPVTLSQSAAILLYCAEKSGKHLPKDPAARPALLQALMSTCTDVTPMLGTIFGIIRSKEPHGPTAEMFKDRWKSYMKVWDTTLGKQKYAAGNEVTIADFSLYAGWARAKGSIPECCQGLPNL